MVDLNIVKSNYYIDFLPSSVFFQNKYRLIFERWLRLVRINHSSDIPSIAPTYRYFNNSTNHIGYIINNLNGLVGTYCLEQMDKSIYYVNSCSIEPNHRRVGLYDTFYNELEKYAFNIGAKYLETEVYETNIKMLDKKEKQGYNFLRMIPPDKSGIRSLRFYKKLKED